MILEQLLESVKHTHIHYHQVSKLSVIVDLYTTMVGELFGDEKSSH